MSNGIASRMVATLLLLLATAAGAFAQDFPTRPIRMVVGFPPGGSNDLLARMLATKLSDRIGRQVVVDNRAGASGAIASEIVATAPADGHTLMLVSVAHTANPSLYKLKYDTEKAFMPIAQLGAGAAVLVIHSSVEAKSLKELVELARKNPGKLHMAHAGNGTYQHMASSQLLNMAGIDVTLVPFKGGGPAMVDVVGGHSQILLVSYVHAVSHLKSGKLRLLGISSANRLENLPDIPTISESGVPGYVSDNWWGVVGPAGIAKPIVDKLISEILAVQDLRDFQETLEREGARSVKLTGAAFGKKISDEIAKWAKVVKDGNIKM